MAPQRVTHTSTPGADPRWSCARKKAYPDEAQARRVAARLNEQNSSGQGRPGYEGVVVVAYACTEGCGRYHVGRSADA